MCVDFRQLNAVTEMDSYALPTVDGILSNLHGCKYFIRLDLQSGYWQIAVDDSIKEMLTFCYESA